MAMRKRSPSAARAIDRLPPPGNQRTGDAPREIIEGTNRKGGADTRPEAPQSQPALNAWGRREWLLAAGLTAITLLTFSSVFRCGFVNYDDGLYVTNNHDVRSGLSARGLRWAWTALMGFWHPLTWMSLELDAELYGVAPAGYHLTNLVWHTGSVLLLFVALRRMTGRTWASAAVACLFAVHPLNVEPVAWVSERKGVLSTFFWMLTLWAYVRYAERPGVRRYLLVLLCLLLGMLSKPILVTLPCVLLLVDFWPLRRFRLAGPLSEAGSPTAPSFPPASLRRLIVEKVPLFALVGLFSVVAVVAEHREGALGSLAELPVEARVKNAAVSYVWYLRQVICPRGLAPFYPHPREGEAWWQAVASALLLVGLTGAVLWRLRREPYLAVGWLWFLGVLFPVIGLVQVGPHARADRYAYVPLVGLQVLLVWGVTDLARRWQAERLAVSCGVLAVVFSMAMSWAQTQYWRDSVSLWEHTLEVTKESALAHNNLGDALLGQGRIAEAVHHLEQAVRVQGDLPPALLHNRAPGGAPLANAHYNLGYAVSMQGNVVKAVRHYREALRLNPASAKTHNSLGSALISLGKEREAVLHFEEALRLDPMYAGAHHNLGGVRLTRGELAEAIRHYQEALRINPDFDQAHGNLGRALLLRGQWRKAADCFRRAVALQPRVAWYHRSLALALHEAGEKKAAQQEYREALRLNPKWPETTKRNAWVMATHPDPLRRNGKQALLLAQQVRQATGAGPGVLDVLAAAYAEVGKFAEATATARKAGAAAAAARQTGLAREINERLRLYEQGRPFRAAP
jgi:tetratricopeptide (TPR) repeat protein